MEGSNQRSASGERDSPPGHSTSVHLEMLKGMHVWELQHSHQPSAEQLEGWHQLGPPWYYLLQYLLAVRIDREIPHVLP